MFMGLFSWIDNGMVASSSPVRGSGMLQCGIRAHVVAWASMGHEEAVTEGGFISVECRLTVKFSKFQKKF